jgi:hypothetical protein
MNGQSIWNLIWKVLISNPENRFNETEISVAFLSPFQLKRELYIIAGHTLPDLSSSIKTSVVPADKHHDT